MKKIDLFVNSIYKFENFIDNNLRIKFIEFIKSKIDLFDNHTAFTGKSISSHYKQHSIKNFEGGNFIFDLFEQNIPEAINFKSKITTSINQVGKELGFNNTQLHNSWANVQYPGDAIRKHSHNFAKISGVLYLNTDEKSSKLYFYNPNLLIVNHNYDFLNSSNFEYFSIVPKNNDLILFPGWLQHGTDYERNESDERISLSFNVQ